MHVGANLPPVKEGYLKDSLPVQDPFPPTAVGTIQRVDLASCTRDLCRFIRFFFTRRYVRGDRYGLRNDSQSRPNGGVAVSCGQFIDTIHPVRVLFRAKMADGSTSFRRSRFPGCRQDDAGNYGELIFLYGAGGWFARPFVFIRDNDSQRASEWGRRLDVGRIAVFGVLVTGRECIVHSSCGLIQDGECCFSVWAYTSRYVGYDGHFGFFGSVYRGYVGDSRGLCRLSIAGLGHPTFWKYNALDVGCFGLGWWMVIPI